MKSENENLEGSILQPVILGPQNHILKVSFQSSNPFPLPAQASAILLLPKAPCQLKDVVILTPFLLINLRRQLACSPALLLLEAPK